MMVDQLLQDAVEADGEPSRFRIVAAGYCLTHNNQSVAKWSAISRDPRWPLLEPTSAEILALFSEEDVS